MAQLRIAQSQGEQLRPKGALGSKCRTGTWLVSLATGHEKKEWTPLGHGLKTSTWGY